MKKTTTKKSPTGAPLGNPLKFFREGGEKTKAMFKNGGYNVPKNSLPKKYNGGPGGPQQGPLEEGTQKYLDAKYPGQSLIFEGPVDPTYEKQQREAAFFKKFNYDNPSQKVIDYDGEMKTLTPQPMGGLKFNKKEMQMEEKGIRQDKNFNTGMNYKRGGIIKKGGAKLKTKKRK
jgi:hypothetical protein